tara:strand:+ start:1114 stop:1467 length:354 start_codon:yes stop_codon:yes gene_type:complete
MRHRKGIKKLNLPTDQRIALIRSLSRSLLQYKRIQTGHQRAKQVQKYVERLITLSKKQTLASRRQALQMLPDKDIVSNMFNTLADQYKTRNGGYTRLTKVTQRRGDGSTISLLELVE